MTDNIMRIISALGLSPHPEGGWFAETWRAPPGADGRSAGTAIHYLLETGGRSHWHQVDAAEFWLWHAGSPLSLLLAPDDAGPVDTIVLGGHILGGERPQIRVPAGQWQAARADRGWALVSCVVVPGFDFAGFTLAAEGWAPGAGGKDAG